MLYSTNPNRDKRRRVSFSTFRVLEPTYEYKTNLIWHQPDNLKTLYRKDKS